MKVVKFGTNFRRIVLTKGVLRGRIILNIKVKQNRMVETMSYQTNLTEGSVVKKYIAFVVPILISGLLQQLYNAADTMVVGKFVGASALAAVGATGSITNLILNMFLGLSGGADVVCARFFGARDKESLHRAIHTSIMLGIVSGVFLALAGFLFSRNLLMMMKTPAEVLDDATLYMQVYFLGAPASMLYNFSAAVLRASGDTKRPLYILTAAGITNVLLNLLFVIVFEMGVLGVAVATVASQVLSAVFALTLLVKNDAEFKLSFKKLRIYKKELLKIAGVGIPSGMNGMMFSVANVIIQVAVNSFGKIVMAATVAAGNISNFVYLVIASSEQAVMTFSGQNIGAGNFKRVDQTLKTGLIFAYICMGILVAVIFGFGENLLAMFVDGDNQADVIEVGMIKLMMVGVGYLLFVPTNLFYAVLKGMGKAFHGMLVNLVCTCLLRILWILVILPMNRTVPMLFAAYPVSWFTASVVMGIVYFTIRRKTFSRIQN